MVALGREFTELHPGNLNYPIRALLPQRVRPDVKIWDIKKPPFPLDQEEEGACVAHAWAGELASAPVQFLVDQAWTWKFWQVVQKQDQLMGNNFGGRGATVLAGAKAARAVNAVGTFRWALTIDDILDTLAFYGPVVMGVDWHESMYTTDRNGLVRIEGPLVGGHCILANQYYKRHRLFGECIGLLNSWNTGWGLNGVGFLRIPELMRLRSANGEFCVATDVARRS